MDGVQHLVLQTAETKGRKVATVFTGFCRYHDKTLFQEIEAEHHVKLDRLNHLLVLQSNSLF